MPQMNKTIRVKLGCDNCGQTAMYDLPARRVIRDWEGRTGEPTFEPSHYARQNGSDHHILLCKFCELPYLKVFWVDETQVAVEVS